MEFELSEDQALIRDAVTDVATRFDDDYWMHHDLEKTFPT